MDRLGRLAVRNAGIALIVLVFTLGLGVFVALPGPGGFSQAVAGHGASTGTALAAGAGGHLTSAVHTPAASATPTQVTMQLLTGLGLYTVLPTTLVVNLTVNNSAIFNWYNATGVEFTNTYLYLNVTDTTTSTVCGSNNITSMITNATMPGVGTNYTEYLTFSLDNSYFVNDTQACPSIAQDPAYIEITAVVNGGPNGVASGVAYQFGVYSLFAPPGYGVNPTTSVVFSTPTSLLRVAPTPGAPQTYTIYANYTAQYVGRVEVSIYTPTGGLAYSANLRWNGTTPTTVPWFEATPGLYPYTLSVYTAYGVYNTSGSIPVVVPTPVYYNTTHWSNSTLISGLSSGAAGAILLVVGLVVGMIVAMALGRAVWGGKRAAPAQPWSGEKTATTNACSVCGQSFATPEELAAHGKSEHGMQ